METRLIWVLMIAITLTTATGAVASGGASASTSGTCSQEVRHDAFRTTEAVDAFNETGQATSRLKNTKVRVTDATGFVRLRASNPNGYCVTYEVLISPEIVSAADLGTIESNSEEYDADWRAAQNLSSGAVYTRVTFTLPAASNATWAPSSVRVKSLSWTGSAKREGSGVLSGLKGWWGSDKVDQRTYEIEPTRNSSRITVPLEKDGEKIEDWNARYTLDGRTRTVTQDASKPVYYSGGGDSVTFHFSQNATDATVTFVAEPTPVEKVGWSFDSWLSGIKFGGDLLEGLPFSTAPTGVVAS
jgi:hypothetical protein